MGWSTTTVLFGSPWSRRSLPAPYQHPVSVCTQYWTSGLTEIAKDSFAQSFGVEARHVARSASVMPSSRSRP